MSLNDLGVGQPVRICIFTFTECQGTADSRVLKEAKTLKQAGYDIRIIAFQGADTAPYEDRDGIKIFRVNLFGCSSFLRKLNSPPSFGVETKVATSPEVSINFIGRIKAIVRSVLSKRAISLVSILAAVYRTFYLWYFFYYCYYCSSFLVARKETADIYHAHDLVTLPVAWLLKIINKGKLVYDCHELWLDRNRIPKRSRLNRAFIQCIESFLIKRTDANIVVSDSIARALSVRYHIAEPAVVFNAPDDYPVKRSDILREQIRIPTGDKIVLYIGFMTPNRGIDELIRALKYLSHCSLVLMGYGGLNYIAVLRKLIEDEAMTGRVHFFGPVPYEEVTRYAASADLGAAPIKNACLSYYYCSPNKIFEYLAASIPVVASNFPDLRKVVEGHRVGVTFDPESPKDIARAIDYVLSDKDKYEEMRKNAMEAAKIYNWRNESKKLLDIYEGLD